MSRRAAFTLLEILLAIVIGLLLLAIAVPSISGMMREQKLKQTFVEFDDFVRAAQARAVKEGRTYVMFFEKDGINLEPLDPSAEAESIDVDRYAFPEGSEWSLERPAALVKKPVWEWPFWRTGNCEPVVVHFSSAAGSWAVAYNGLTGRGKMTDLDVK